MLHTCLDDDLLSLSVSLKVACKKYEAAIQMLQDMSDRYSSTLAMLGLVKSLLALDTHNQMVRERGPHLICHVFAVGSYRVFSLLISLQTTEILATALSTSISMGNKLMQARCHLLNERVLTSANQLDDARQASDLAQRLYLEADLLCSVCEKPMGMHPEQIQILTCTHIFHERLAENSSCSRGRAFVYSF